MKKICIITAAIPPSHSGAGLAAFKYAYRLHKKGLLGLLLTRTKVKLTEKDYHQYLGEYDEEFDAKIKRTTVKVSSSNNLIAKLLTYPIDFTLLYAVSIWILFKNRKNYDIVHCFSPTWFSLIAVMAGKFMRKKVVLEITRQDGDDPSYVASYDKLKILYQRRNIQYLLADAIVCLSPALVDRCKANKLINLNKLYQIPRAYNEDLFYPEESKKHLREELGLNGYHPILLFVGGIIPRKGVNILTGIVQQLKKDLPDIKFVLAGPPGNSENDKIYKKDIDKLIQKNDLEDNISFTGYVSNVHEYMKASDFFLFPSQSEGLPNVVIEAMACGLVVIMNDIEGISDYIIQNGKDGYIISDNNPEKYAQIIKSLVSDPMSYDSVSKNAVNKAANKFSPVVIDNKYQDIYRDLIDGNM